MSITKLTLTRNNKSLVIGIGKPYLLIKVEGLAELEADERTYNSANIDGATYRDSILNIREITIDITVLANRQEDLLPLKEEIIKMCNPKAGKFTLDVENGNTIRTIEVVADGIPNLNLKGNSLESNGTITLLAHKPWLLSKLELGENINTWLGGWELPFSFPVSFSEKGPNSKNIINEGHVPTPLFITFKGPASNPRIINILTGEYIKVNQDLTADEILTITTEKGNKRVEITRQNGTVENAFNYIDLSSKFFELEVGDNILEYSSENSLEPSEVYVSYRNRYLGM